MQLKYGQTKTYKYELDEDKLNWLSELTNRSKGQTLFLFQLVGGDFVKLQELESQIKMVKGSYCPSDIETVNEILSIKKDIKRLSKKQLIIDTDNTLCKITDTITGKASNSVEVYIKAKSKEGINHKQWLTEREFFIRFKPIKY